MSTSNRMRLKLLCLWLAATLPGCALSGKCGRFDCPADAKITAEVQTLLAGSPSLGAPNQISVQTVNGVVYLRGLVSTPFQIENAGALARQAPGVTHVENQISLDESR